MSGSSRDTPSAFPLNSFKLLPICSDLFYHKKYNLMPRSKFQFCKKKHFNPAFSEKGTTQHLWTIYHSILKQGLNMQSTGDATVCSVRKKTSDLSFRIHFSKYNPGGLTVLPSVSLSATSDQHLCRNNERFFIQLCHKNYISKTNRIKKKI